MQRYTIFFITLNALHVSGGFSAHHPELKKCTHGIGCTSSLFAAAASVGVFIKIKIKYKKNNLFPSRRLTFNEKKKLILYSSHCYMHTLIVLQIFQSVLLLRLWFDPPDLLVGPHNLVMKRTLTNEGGSAAF